MREKIESLEAKVAALEGNAKKSAATVPSWKGAPQLEDKEEGWSFKPFGRLQYDVGHVGSPDGVSNSGLGFSNELRRGRIGVEGSIPGGFGYKVEVDFADNAVEVTDAFLSYAASKQVGIVIGQHNGFQSMEELTSSRFTSFMERAAFTDAFNFERRVGLSATYASGIVLAQGGVFTDNIEDLADIGDDNNAVSIDGRLVVAPKAGDTQLHFGASGASSRQWRRRRSRRNALPATPLCPHQRRALPRNPGAQRAGGNQLRSGSGADPWPLPCRWRGPLARLPIPMTAGSPTYFGGYAELGYFLTGETRGYKGGRFDRTKVRNPVGKGGAGAFQINLRYDYLDLNDDGIVGGKQSGYEASLIWIPQDYVRFLLNYARLQYEDAAVAAADGDRDYGIDVIGARAQIDF